MEVNFKYKLYDRIDTPLVSNAIITMLGYDEGGNVYFCDNNKEGAVSRWWPEDRLKLTE